MRMKSWGFNIRRAVWFRDISSDIVYGVVKLMVNGWKHVEIREEPVQLCSQNWNVSGDCLSLLSDRASAATAVLNSFYIWDRPLKR